MSEDPLRDVILDVVPVDYLASYEATVVLQDTSDLTLEVICDDARIGHLAKVTLYVGIPEARVQVLPESRVTIRFAGADPKRYYAIGMAMDLAADKRVARQDDPVAIGTLTGTAPPGGGPVTFIFTPAGGLPAAPTQTITLSGFIQDGHPRIKVSSVGQ